MTPERLNLGCGSQRRADWLNVDKLAALRPDLVWDLDQYPYPLPRAHFSHIVASDVVEHLSDIPRFMEEVHALLRPGGTIEITTPHFSCANSFTDPTHRHHLGYFSFDYFTAQGPWSFYSTAKFEIVERKIVFSPGRLTRLLGWWANRRPHAYEQRLAWMLPAWFLIFKLRCVK